MMFENWCGGASARFSRTFSCCSRLRSSSLRTRRRSSLAAFGDLCDVVGRAEPQRFDRGVGRGERRHDDADDRRVDALRLAQHVDAAHLGHPDVGDQDVDPLALAGSRPPPCRPRRPAPRSRRAAARSTAAPASIARRRRRARARCRRRPASAVWHVGGHDQSRHGVSTSRPAFGRPRERQRRPSPSCPCPRSERHLHLAAVVADDAVDDRQAEPVPRAKPPRNGWKMPSSSSAAMPTPSSRTRDHHVAVRLRRLVGVDRRASARRRPASRAARWSPGSRRSAGSAPRRPGTTPARPARRRRSRAPSAQLGTVLSSVAVSVMTCRTSIVAHRLPLRPA